jgi:hypothetical protein
MQHRLGVVRVIDVLAHSHYVSALLHEVLDVLVSALVCQLGKLNSFTCKLFVQII